MQCNACIPISKDYFTFKNYEDQITQITAPGLKYPYFWCTNGCISLCMKIINSYFWNSYSNGFEVRFLFSKEKHS